MNFTDFKLNKELEQALEDIKYLLPTPIQEKAMPLVLENKDVVGIAQTGTGKTAAFALPILQRLLNSSKKTQNQHPRAIILAPTRELCAQIGDNVKLYSKYTDISSLVTIGGVSPLPQIEALKGKVDILIATPGRLVDLVIQKDVLLKDVEVLVLDEADHIIEMGLRVDLKKILKSMPKERQNLLFSATMNKEIKSTVDEISGNLTKKNHNGLTGVLNEPEVVEVEAEEISLKLINQNVLYVLKEHKIRAMLELLKKKEVKYIIIFTNTKQTADDIVRSLVKNEIKSFALHSGKSNTHREKVIKQLNLRELKVVVATDLAARGLDFEYMTHVINFEIPNSFEKYVHRVGRIGRAGKQGVAYSMCALDERDMFEKILKSSKHPIITHMHQYHSNLVKTNSKLKSKKTYFKAKPKQTSGTYSNRKGKR
jgi:ATP-dependent RNA helicase RhlE